MTAGESESYFILSENRADRLPKILSRNEILQSDRAQLDCSWVIVYPKQSNAFFENNETLSRCVDTRGNARKFSHQYPTYQKVLAAGQ